MSHKKQKGPSLEHLTLGVNAVALTGGSPSWEPREISGVLLPLRDAGGRLDEGAAAAFELAASRADSTTADIIRYYSPRAGSLHALVRFIVSFFADQSWKPTQSPDGFRYGVTGNVTLEEADAFAQGLRAAFERRESKSRPSEL